MLFSCKKEDVVSPTMYSKVNITKVEVLSYPFANNTGNTWDDNVTSNSNPDMYFRIAKAGTTTELFTTSNHVIDNVTSAMLPIAWNGAPIVQVLDLNQANFDFDFYDYDGLSSNDFMGTITLNFKDYTTGSNQFPTQKEITVGLFTIRISMYWSN